MLTYKKSPIVIKDTKTQAIHFFFQFGETSYLHPSLIMQLL